MSDMAIPDFQTLMLPMLKIGNSGEIQAKQATELLSDEFGLTDEERTQLLPSGTTTTIHNRVAWAVSHMVQAKLLKRPQRGYFTTTDRGKAVLQSPPDRITIKYLEQFPEYVEFRKKKKVTEKVEADGADEDSSTTPEERIDTAYSEINAALKDELLSKVMEASPVFFEKLIVKLLVGMGYGGASDEAGKHVGKSGDGGIDGVINEDKLGLDVIYLQAKRYAPENTVGRPEIQKFAGTLIGMSANKGVFVTTSSFSAQAHEYTKTAPQRIILIDGEKLTSLMLEHNVGARVHRSIDLKNIDEDFFLD